MITIAFFNHKAGVGKTSLAYHLAWMFADQGVKVVIADFDPQAHLTSMFLDEERREELWPEGSHPKTFLGALEAAMNERDETLSLHVEDVADNLGLMIGDLGLALFEERLSDAWSKGKKRDEEIFRLTSAFHRVVVQAANDREANLALIDVGSSLGAISQAAIMSAQWVLVPMMPDLLSLQALRDLGPTWRRWQGEWVESLKKHPMVDFQLPRDGMQPAGYVVQRQPIRVGRTYQSLYRRMARIPAEYRASVLGELSSNPPALESDPECLALLRHYPSLMSMALDAQKPMFLLKPADGAVGAQAKSVQDCYMEYKALALRLAKRCGVIIS